MAARALSWQEEPNPASVHPGVLQEGVWDVPVPQGSLTPHSCSHCLFYFHIQYSPLQPPPKKDPQLWKNNTHKKKPSAYLNPKTLISPLHLLSQPGGDMQVMVSPTGEIHGKDSFRQSCFSFLSPITSPKSPGPSQPLQQPGLLQAHQWLVGSCWPDGTSEMGPPLGRRHRVAQAVSL